YGITETTVHVTSRRLLAADARENGGSPIGRRLGDLQVYVLDAWMQPVPVGVAGEVYVGGAGLARGYLRRPALTAERFVPHPFGGAGGERLYRSGDVARLAADGSLEYLGRCDGQVKVRGFRIEPGEIEAALRQHEAVKEALVVAAEGGRRLVAYVTAAEDARARALADELRAHLKGRLPDYMVPAAFVLLERLPLSANGKIDRRALPEPDEAAPSPGAGHVAPGDAVEEALAAIWGAVLNVERVGIHDNFFDLGGDSIRSVRVLAMAKERGLEFSLQQLFQHQTVGELAREIRAAAGADPLPAAKPEPFGLVSDGDRSQVPAGVEDAYPLAMLQAGMLYHMAYTPGQIVYHNVYSYHLRGRFDPELFQETLRGVVERHAILRTSFDLTAYSEPLQLVHRAVDFPVRVDDLRGLGHEKQETILAEFVEAEKGRPFDLSRPPLLRFHIHRRTDETFNFTFTECHPILDGWSLHSLLAEIFSTYFARLKGGQAAPRPPLASSYRDFVALERAALNSEACQHYWGRKLDDCPASELPRWPGALPGGDGPRIERLHFPLSEEMSARLRRLARSLGVPLKSVLLAAHLKALGVMSGRADVLTGLVSGGRPEEADGENVLGLFFNTLPFRGDVSGGTWADLIRRTFKEELESLPFRRYPVAALQQRRGRRPIFESVFNYLHFHVLDDLLKSDDLGFLGVSSYWEETNLTFSVAFMLPPLSSQILLTLRYDATSFPAAQMQAAGGIYERILAAMVGDPSAPHGPQCFLPEAELERLLVRWNDTGAGRRPARCVHQSFEQQAAERPDAFAVACEGERLTYGELNRRANRLARYLQARGVGPEARVGICLERSARTLVAILGVMKAGGAYVALDAAYPAERNASILEQARVHILLTESRLAGGLPACGAPAVCIDSDPGLIGEAGEGNVSSGVAPGNAAYLLFTSGSTGRPKGVVVEHAQLTNYAEGILERLRPPAGASFAMLSTFATDLGNTVLFPALLTGGCLHVLSQEQAADPLTVADYFTRHPIDCLKIVPSHLAALLASPSAERVLPRRRLIMGGEAASSHLLERLRELAPGCAVFNHYGPTETTVGVLTHEVEQAPPGRVPEALPLGRPLPNVQIYLLDQSLVPVPVGTAGELYVGGANVARGYFGRPALTAEKFLPHPFGRVPGARLYRTGDVARYLPDGKVEFLGRLDSQVKIRGYRVELGEVENVLSQHPGVREAVVTAREGAPGTRRLVAYVVLDADAPPAAGEMRNFLRAKLPDFMIPSSFVRLESLPLTPGGKVNRGALPTPPDPGADAGTVHVSPRNEVERAIASVWGEALRAEHFGVHDNFFDLGGHSLILLQVQSKLRQVFGREISIVEMFEHPTVRALADHLGRRQDEPTVSPHVYEEAEARRALLRRRQTTLQPET
ncbi:MAG TPA: amino acid adenylation domain-containing protein, partial [Pyrinomonadaceae bacterium]